MTSAIMFAFSCALSLFIYIVTVTCTRISFQPPAFILDIPSASLFISVVPEPVWLLLIKETSISIFIFFVTYVKLLALP